MSIASILPVGSRPEDQLGITQSEPPKGNHITLDEFKKADLRVGTITAAERVPGSEKLLKLTVDLGDLDHARQIVSGIAGSYAPENLVGTQGVFIVNLASRMMMGLESRGMLLAAGSEEDGPAILQPNREMPPGAPVR